MEKLPIDDLKTEVQCDMSRDEMQEYVRLTKELGIANPKARQEELKAFLAENNITVYPYKDVSNYLRKKAETEGGQNTYWCWKPLREQDKARVSHTQSIQRVWGDQIRQDMLSRMYAAGLQAATLGTATATSTLAAQQQAMMEPLRRALPHGSFQTETVYAHSIPLPVLLTMKTIVSQFPDAQFYASDYEVQRPDPFLAVTLPGVEDLFIIERWDEPGFRM